jgi:hypothetical protein
MLGRFTQIDPVIIDTNRPEFSLAMLTPQLLNGYAYTGNNPIKHVDEDGEFLDTVIDAAFIAYDLYKVGQAIANGGSVSSELKALGLDVAGAALPGVTGLGMISRIDDVAKVVSKADDVVDTVKAGVSAVNKAQDATKAVKAGDKAADLVKAGQKLPDSALVVRGGAKTTPEVFHMGTHKASGLKGFSVESKAGANLCELCTRVPHNQVRVPL